MDLVISPDGNVRAIYAEDIELGVLGRTTSAEPVTSNLTLRGVGSRI